MPRRLGGPAAASIALAALLIACFSRLAAEPSALLVDADRPTVDHARPADDRSTGNDATRLFLPHHLAIARHLARDGHVPMWDDRGFGGRPLVGNPQAGLFYPPAWLAWLSGAPSALGWITVGHLAWAALGTYRLGRTLGLGGRGCLVAAGCVEASPYFLAQVAEGHYPHVWAASWYPWAFAAALRLRRGEARAGLALAPILAATFLAGHPQEGYYLLIALAAWAALDGVAAIRAGRSRSALGLWACWAAVVALATGLAGVEIVPDAMAQGWGLRSARLTLRMASRYHPFPVNALQLLGPRALGGPADYFGHDNYWEAVLSVGLVPLLLAVVGVAWARDRDRRAVRGWATLAAAAVVFASGRKLGLFAAMFTVVPGMDRFRVPSRALFLATLGAAILAGYGVEAPRARSADRAAWARLARRWAAVAIALGLAVAAGRGLADRRDVAASVLDRPATARVPESDRWLLGLARLSGDPTFWLALTGPTLALGWGWLRPTGRRAVAATLGGLALIELGLYGHASIATAPAARFLGPNAIDEALARARPPGLEPPRIRAVAGVYDDLRAGRIGLTKTDVNDLFQIGHAADLYETLYPPSRPDRFDRDRPMDGPASLHRRQVRRAVLDRMGVALLVSDRADPDFARDQVASGSVAGSPFVVARNPTALPRAYVVPRAEVAPDDAATVARFLDVDPRQAVLMPADPLGHPTGPRQPFTPAEWASADPDRVVLRVATVAPGLLVIADTWMPGWTAAVDGHPAPVLRGNRAQRVVPLPEPGRHEVVLRYRPPGLDAGLALTAASASTWLALLLAPTIARLRHPSLTRRGSTG